MALDKMRKAYATDEVRDLILAHEMWEHDQASLIEAARRAERVEMARKFLAEGVPLDRVAKITELRPEEFQS